MSIRKYVVALRQKWEEVYNFQPILSIVGEMRKRMPQRSIFKILGGLNLGFELQQVQIYPFFDMKLAKKLLLAF